MKKLEISLVLLLIVSSLSILFFNRKGLEIIPVSRATSTEILVEVDKTQGPLSRPWQYFAQGGEEAEPMLDDIASELGALKPAYIRIDAIFNFYDVVGGKNNGRMTFNWNKLDQRVQDILNTGATPLLPLSYMPRVLTLNAVRDPSFEEGISGYVYNPPGARVTMTRISSGYEGVSSLKLDNREGTAKGYYFVEAGNKDGNLNDNIDVRYDWSVFVRTDSPSQDGVGLTWHAGPETYFAASSDWQKILVNGKIGPEQPFSRWYIIVPPGRVVYIDNLELTANPYNGIYDPTPPPYWSDWQEVVQATMEHYSGKNQKNLSDIYYEVWNEPQVFGGWSIDDSTLNDYRLLYKYAAQGAQEAQNVNSFKFGGPSSVIADQGWMTTFFKFVKENNLRCDFISWHTYTDDPSAMARDIDNINSWKAPFPNVTNAEKLITEWGPFAGNSENDNEFSAAYSVVALRNLLEKNVKPFVFEIKDGPWSDKECWGRWGMITHEKFGKHKKAEYNAFKALSLLKSNRISLTGENSFVKGIASRNDDGSLALVLANYDKNKVHAEEISLNISGLPNGNYTFQEYLIDATHSNYCQNPTSEELTQIVNEQIVVTQNSLNRRIAMGPNNVILITLNYLPPTLYLSPDWNQITWPDTPNYTAKTALEDIDNDCGAGTAVAIAKKEKDWWEDFVKNYGGMNFGLQNNQNYFINVSKSCNWSP